VQLPDGIEGVIVLNINSYGGGATLWPVDHEEDSTVSPLGPHASSHHVHPSLEEGVATSDGGTVGVTARHSPYPVVHDGRDCGVSGGGGGASSGGGRAVWRVPSTCDGVVEVVGVTGSLHLARLQVGLSSGAIRLAQGRTVTVRMSAPMPMQIDGEPWIQAGPCELSVKWRLQHAMARCVDAGGAGAAAAADGDDALDSSRLTPHRSRAQRPGDGDADGHADSPMSLDEVVRLLRWGIDTGVITAPQNEALLHELQRRMVSSSQTML
jgi:hypothetical protein